MCKFFPFILHFLGLFYTIPPKPAYFCINLPNSAYFSSKICISQNFFVSLHAERVQ